MSIDIPDGYTDLNRRMEEMTSRIQQLEANRELLIRIDERMNTLIDELRKIQGDNVSRKDFDDFRATVITIADFDPVRKIAFGAISGLGAIFLAALVYFFHLQSK